MLMSMVVAFTITPWLAYHVLGRRFRTGDGSAESAAVAAHPKPHGLYDVEATKRTLLYRLFRPLMLPLVQSRAVGITFLVVTAVATVAAVGALPLVSVLVTKAHTAVATSAAVGMPPVRVRAV
jgi:multidrug efflux pump subunit AcrB